MAVSGIALCLCFISTVCFHRVLGIRTGGLLAKTLADLAGVLEVEVPAGGLAGLVLEGESEDGVGLLDGILAVGFAGVESLVHEVEGSRGGELGCGQWVSLNVLVSRQLVSCRD